MFRRVNRILILVLCIISATAPARAQTMIMPVPPYPEAARKMGLQGRGVVRVTFANYLAYPVSVEMVKSTGSSVLDEAVLDYARRNWTLIYFTPAQKKDPALLDRLLLPFIPNPVRRREAVERWRNSPPSKPPPLPLTKVVPVAFVTS